MGRSFELSTNLSNKMYGVISRTWETRWLLPSLFPLCVLLFLLRKPLPILLQPGRVEDVDILLTQALQNGWQSLFVVYNYYFHLVPRLVTLVSLSLLGIANVNLGMNFSAIIIAVLCALFFATKQFRFVIKSDLLRIACSFFIILVPGVNEIYSNISSIQWFLNIFIMLFVAILLFRHEEYEKKPVKIKYLYTFLLSASILSSAFSLVFLPVLIYVIIREARKSQKQLATISSYVIPTFFMIFEAATLYITYTQQFRSSSLGVTKDVLGPTANAFAISISKVFYYDTPKIFQYFGDWMYLIPLAVVAFVILNSIKDRSKFEIYALLCMGATLFWSSAVRGSMLDWGCLCGQTEERYFFLTVVFAFILIVKQFDKRRSIIFKSLFVVLMIVVIMNISSGFLIPSSADANWRYVTQLYDASGSYKCYVGEIPHGWALSVPCSNPTSNSSSKVSPPSETGPSVTFMPPIVSTNTKTSSDSAAVIYGLPISFTATVSPTPDSGTIQFQVDGTNMGMPVTIYGGQAKTNTSSLEIGTHKISALYSGGPNFYSSVSGPLTIAVLPRSDLKGASLSGSSLAGVNLSGLDMERANLSQANLNGAILSKANLQDVDLTRALLVGANLRGANLEKATLQSANLQNANLVQADLQGGDLTGAIFSGANLTDANLTGADIEGANFAGAVTKGCHGCP